MLSGHLWLSFDFERQIVNDGTISYCLLVDNSEQGSTLNVEILLQSFNLMIVSFLFVPNSATSLRRPRPLCPVSIPFVCAGSAPLVRTSTILPLSPPRKPPDFTLREWNSYDKGAMTGTIRSLCPPPIERRSIR
jgi:hypothetical protein